MAGLHFKKSLHDLRFKDDGLSTTTSEEQRKVENNVSLNYQSYLEVLGIDPEFPLHRTKHVKYLLRGLRHLSDSYECLDASRPWLCYWILHSLDLLKETVSPFVTSEVVDFLGRCQHSEGGFGGGPGQVPHLAPTYAAVCSLTIIGTKEALAVIDRQGLKRFLLRCRTAEGAYKMHEDGEVDIRGVYCAMVAAYLTNILTPSLIEGTAEWIKKCQTYEGGFSGEPGLEAHGGYSFCGFSALVLIGKENIINIKKLLYWAASRQMKLEGGFQGRTNKLVDGCYSFWQGGIFPVIHNVLEADHDNLISTEKWMFDQTALQNYVLINCQYHAGGLIDKPGKSRDFYHTCYCLSGLSAAQNFILKSHYTVNTVGGEENLLKPIHPLYNISVDKALAASKHFKSLEIPE